MDKYDDVIEQFQTFCLKTSNKVVKRHQLLSTKQGCLSVDEYVTALHKIACECSLDTMYDDFFLQALLLGSNDEQVTQKLFEDDDLKVDQAIKKCKVAEASKNDLKTIRADAEESVHALRRRGRPNKPYKGKQNADVLHNKPKGKCGNCGQSHPPKRCSAYGKQCHGCNKFDHFKMFCRSARQVHQLAEEESGSGSDESLLCLQVIRSNRKLMSTIQTRYKDKQVKILYQLDTGASCNVLNYQDYCALDKPSLNDHRPDLKLFDGSTTKPLGECRVLIAGKPYDCYVVRTNNLSLLSGNTCLDLGLITIKHELVNIISTSTTVEQLVDQYSDVFHGVGCLPGEYRIQLDKDTVPMKNHNRKVPVSMLADLKTKLECLE